MDLRRSLSKIKKGDDDLSGGNKFVKLFSPRRKKTKEIQAPQEIPHPENVVRVYLADRTTWRQISFEKNTTTEELCSVFAQQINLVASATLFDLIEFNRGREKILSKVSRIQDIISNWTGSGFKGLPNDYDEFKLIIKFKESEKKKAIQRLSKRLSTYVTDQIPDDTNQPVLASTYSPSTELNSDPISQPTLLTSSLKTLPSQVSQPPQRKPPPPPQHISSSSPPPSSITASSSSPMPISSSCSPPSSPSPLRSSPKSITSTSEIISPRTTNNVPTRPSRPPKNKPPPTPTPSSSSSQHHQHQQVQVTSSQETLSPRTPNSPNSNPRKHTDPIRSPPSPNPNNIRKQTDPLRSPTSILPTHNTNSSVHKISSSNVSISSKSSPSPSSSITLSTSSSDSVDSSDFMNQLQQFRLSATIKNPKPRDSELITIDDLDFPLSPKEGGGGGGGGGGDVLSEELYEQLDTALLPVLLYRRSLYLGPSLDNQNQLKNEKINKGSGSNSSTVGGGSGNGSRGRGESNSSGGSSDISDLTVSTQELDDLDSLLIDLAVYDFQGHDDDDDDDDDVEND